MVTDKLDLKKIERLKKERGQRKLTVRDKLDLKKIESIKKESEKRKLL